jgi:hypothetical protein
MTYSNPALLSPLIFKHKTFSTNKKLTLLNNQLITFAIFVKLIHAPLLYCRIFIVKIEL